MATAIKFRKKSKGASKTVKYPSIQAAVEATGIPYMTLYMRIQQLGWSVARAVNTPVRSYKKVAA